MKQIIFLLLAVSILVSGCNQKKDEPKVKSENPNEVTKQNTAPPIKMPELKKYFDEYKAKGCIVIYDAANNIYTYYDSARCNQGFLPASTFKIPNSLISLEAGAVKDENEKLKWDGTVRKTREEWNQDTDMRMAFKYSTVWFYQECARRVGASKMQHYIDTLNYGNKNISAGIDKFWLEGPMRITAMEQLALLRNIQKDKVPFSQRNIDILKSIMILDDNEAYTFRGKTGTALNDDKVSGQNIGWFVGYLTTKNNIYFFVLNVDIDRDNIMYNERLAMPRKIFNDMGLTKFKID